MHAPIFCVFATVAIRVSLFRNASRLGRIVSNDIVDKQGSTIRAYLEMGLVRIGALPLLMVSSPMTKAP